MKLIIGTKQNMTQIFDKEGRVHPATVLSTGPVVVTQIKNKEKDGYEAVQVGYGEKKEKKVNKAQKTKGNFKGFKEFEGGKDEYKVGDKIDISAFAEGDKIEISSISKGKGFQGVVKRHGFHGGPRTHGQKHSEREPGSIGATGPQRVFKGKKMGGRMGSDRVTLKKVKIIQIDKDNNQLVVRGAVPGRRGTIVEIKGN
ncbi:MAG: 50S ribosomal protein L3 [Candidatus Pacebacteria bacterium]|jgi:large subunit ribosomal protein L3|nr:50S ribosomal protein L3 [Parcubacteria group bacterium]MDP6249684.1 50S ribosomal protein L3 [Candidatus Paceibacterota bacterium]MDP7159353.1 50S ribosomal protein L3 [Candidatus Paceibacterota bacterium]MDP7368407.1 50S ribosomal protein L3 [Candidatus Paceibacterota bacterium]MDP7466358.1 50S ribosomal protein L3 [Candidatus Paceibacterota bacterium]|tara:strand:+ start:1985 stop:2581 length:597 start_codon:yes stop_codon:yes gene_type:complete